MTVLEGARVDLVRLGPIDAGEMLTLQRAAYVSEARAHGDLDLPPLTETLDDLRATLADPSVTALGLRADSRLVASVRIRVVGTEADLGRLVVVPDLQGNGLGSRLLLAAESVVPPDTAVVRLFTGERSTRNIELYRRHGYAETHRTPAGSYHLVHLVKRLEVSRGPEHRRLAEIEAAARSRDSVTPDSVTPDAVTPDAVTPDAVTPDSVTPEPATPESPTEVIEGVVIQVGGHRPVAEAVPESVPAP